MRNAVLGLIAGLLVACFWENLQYAEQVCVPEPMTEIWLNTLAVHDNPYSMGPLFGFPGGRITGVHASSVDTGDSVWAISFTGGDKVPSSSVKIADEGNAYGFLPASFASGFYGGTAFVMTTTAADPDEFSLFSSTNGVSWAKIAGLPQNPFSDGDTTYVYWQYAVARDTGKHVLIFSLHDSIFGAKTAVYLQTSTDGVSWSSPTNILASWSGVGLHGESAAPMSVSPDGNTIAIVYDTDGRVVYSLDGGSTWDTHTWVGSEDQIFSIVAYNGGFAAVDQFSGQSAEVHFFDGSSGSTASYTDGSLEGLAYAYEYYHTTSYQLKNDKFLVPLSSAYHASPPTNNMELPYLEVDVVAETLTRRNLIVPEGTIYYASPAGRFYEDSDGDLHYWFVAEAAEAKLGYFSDKYADE